MTHVTSTEYLLEMARNKAVTRDGMAVAYMRALHMSNVNWHDVNAAIVERWSVSALKYIKERAWEIL